ncbi:MAG: O-antigen ligase family protein [Chloroflexota bacterium]|nr:O-antigen ligase family protein [Chloroflexota bacterium]
MQLSHPAPIVASPLRPAVAVAAAAGAGASVLIGWLTATRSPLLAASCVAGAVGVAWALRRPHIALAGLVTVIALLPFGVAPLRLGVAPTLLDLVTALVFFLWLALAAAGRLTPAPRPGLGSDLPGLTLVAFAATLCAAFLLSGAAVGVDESGRAFVKLVLAHLLFLPLLSLVRAPNATRRLVAWLLVVVGAEAVVGLGLYFAPRALAYRALAALGPLGYPTDASVLRYRPDTDILRATGTSVDPNMLGALLMVAAALAVPLVLARHPAVSRVILVVVLLPIIPCLLLTESRGSWLGLAGAVLFVAAVRYRRLLVLLLLTGPLLLAAPAAQRFTGHLLSGLQAQDRASAMRLGELQNAATLIIAHPWFGVGWGDGGQSIELLFTLGVSNVYLTVAERAGLPALAIYLIALAALGATLWPAVRRRWRSPADDGLLLGLVAALVATQIAGMLDHHFIRFPHLVSVLWLLAALAVAEAQGVRAWRAR